MFGGHTNWLVIIILGGLAGGLAKLLMPGRDPGGCIITIILGIAGAFLGTWLGRLVGLYGPNDNAGFIGAVLGAIVLLLLYRVILGRRRV
ncbi:MAG TPA: GlsB/YeaQ/YmgE family stress response membrane protein [Sphingomicrobium sp.]